MSALLGQVFWVNTLPCIRYLVYFVNYIRLCDTQEVVVALQWKRVFFKLVTPEIFLLKLMLLDHGSHTTI